LDRYTDEFFNEFNLILVTKSEGIPTQHKVEKIVLKDRELHIRIKRKVPGLWETTITEGNFWCHLIPVRKDYFDGDKVIVEYRDTTKAW